MTLPILEMFARHMAVNSRDIAVYAIHCLFGNTTALHGFAAAKKISNSWLIA